MNSLGADFATRRRSHLDTPEAQEALEAMIALMPYMDPQVTTFDQPTVQQQMYNGTAAMSIMFSGPDERPHPRDEQPAGRQLRLRRAAEGQRRGGVRSTTAFRSTAGPSRSTRKLDHDMLFVMMASAVSEDASKASVPAAYPAREGMVTGARTRRTARLRTRRSPRAMPPCVSPVLADITNAIRPILAEVITGKPSRSRTAWLQMQAAASHRRLNPTTKPTDPDDPSTVAWTPVQATVRREENRS